jgi:hypothetical protein
VPSASADVGGVAAQDGPTQAEQGQREGQSEVGAAVGMVSADACPEARPPGLAQVLAPGLAYRLASTRGVLLVWRCIIFGWLHRLGPRRSGDRIRSASLRSRHGGVSVRVEVGIVRIGARHYVIAHSHGLPAAGLPNLPSATDSRRRLHPGL